jgi:hypothetical protein
MPSFNTHVWPAGHPVVEQFCVPMPVPASRVIDVVHADTHGPPVVLHVSAAEAVLQAGVSWVRHAVRQVVSLQSHAT